MKAMTRMVFGVGMLCATLVAQAQPAQQGAPGATQPYPNKPIRLVVPFGAGGPMDALARAVGEKLTASMGQIILVDNKPGANTIIGADTVVKSPADGYTLLLAPTSHAINPNFIAKLPYDARRDFTAYLGGNRRPVNDSC